MTIVIKYVHDKGYEQLEIHQSPTLHLSLKRSKMLQEIIVKLKWNKLHSNTLIIYDSETETVKQYNFKYDKIWNIDILF